MSFVYLVVKKFRPFPFLRFPPPVPLSVYSVYSVGHSSGLDRSSFIVIVLFLLPPPVPLSVYSVGHSSYSRFFVFAPPIPKAATDLPHSPAAQLTAHCLFPHGQIPSHFLRTAAFKIPLQRFDQDR